MTKASRGKAAPTKVPAVKSAANKDRPSARRKAGNSSTNLAIATELAPAVAIALLDKTDQPAGAPAPALEVLAVGAAASQVKGNVRLQLMFENGSVLPVEMSKAAGLALSKGLKDELPGR
jgi:hypothetical protein